MDRDDLIRRLRKRGRREGVAVDWDTARGKGSHGTLHYGTRRAVVPQGELKTGTLRAILRQLGLDPEDI